MGETIRSAAATLVAAVCVVVSAAQARAEDRSARVDAPHVRVELVSRTNAVRRGSETTVGVVYRPEEHWHVYWVNPGETGAPPRVDLSAPGAELGAPAWPAPSRLEASGLVSFVYEGEILVTTTLRVPETFDGDTVTLTADLEWLVCDEGGCIAGFAELELTLPVLDGEPFADPRTAARFDAAARRVPQPTAGARALSAESGVILEATEAALRRALADSKQPWFFPYEDGALAVTLPVRDGDDSARLRLATADGRPLPAGARLTGVLSLDAPDGSARRAFDLDLIVADDQSRGGAASDSGTATSAPSTIPWPVSLVIGLVLMVGGVFSVVSGARRPRSEPGS